MKRHLALAIVIATLAACGSALDLGDRRVADAGAGVDSSAAGADADANTDDASRPDAPQATTCGRGTPRPSCRVFVTEAKTEANFGGLMGADARCDAAAAAASLTGKFKAFLSDGVIAAWSRFQSDGPWVLLGSNEPLFANAAALKMDGPHSFNRNERGESLSIPGHWTGVREQGFAGDACAGFTSKSPALRGSFGSTAPSRWLFQASANCDAPTGFHLLCFED